MCIVHGGVTPRTPGAPPEGSTLLLYSSVAAGHDLPGAIRVGS